MGNLKLSISNIHIRYEDLESNPGHPFAAGLTLENLSAVTTDDSGNETFVTGGALDRIQKSIELDRLALYLDSDTLQWYIDKPWEDLLPVECVQVFKFGTKDGRPADHPIEEHNYILQPVTGDAKYLKLRQNESSNSDQPLQKAVVSLDNVTLCLTKDGYRDILKVADNFTAFNQRLKYAHYHPRFSLKSNPRSWWKYAYKAVSDHMKKASGKILWEQVLRYARLRKKYVSLYASLLKSDVNRLVVADNKEIEELDRELDIELILQWRLVMKGDTVEMNANALGLTMESNGINTLEPFDTSIKYLNSYGKINIHLSVSDILMNISFSILRLFLAVEEDILAFLSTTSKEITVECSQFDRVGTIKIFTCQGQTTYKSEGEIKSEILSNGEQESNCSVWFPEAPEGYIALGCVVSPGKLQPSSSSTFCIPASFVSPCSLRDCITITNQYPSSLAFWRVDNSLGTFLPAEPTTLRLLAAAYELRHIIIRSPEVYPKPSRVSEIQTSSHGCVNNRQFENSSVVNIGRCFEAVASFKLVWWNRGSSSRKQLSIWRPMISLGMVYFGDIAVQGYEPPNTCTVLHDSGDDHYKAPIGFQLVGKIKKQRGIDSVTFWLPQAPPSYVSLGCIACKGPPKQQDFCTLRCIRSDMVTGDKFLEESVLDTSDAKFGTEPFSIWVVANDLGTFVVRDGSRKPPKRSALKQVDPCLHSASDNTVLDAEIGTFFVALFDDFSGLMVPLINISLSGIAFSLHGRSDKLNSTASFSLAARSYNDKYESWEPIVEPMDGFLRYQYDPNSSGAASQLRFTSTRDLNLNISESNANMIIQAYASWNNHSDIHQYHKTQEVLCPTSPARSIVDVHHKRSYYIIPQNKLGHDIFIRTTENKGFEDIIRMSSGDMKPIKVPVSKNMLDSHLKGKLCGKIRTMVTVIIADAMLPRVEGLTSHHYTVAVRVSPDHSLPSESLIHQQSARTCGRTSSHVSSDIELVDWSEIFFFKVDSPDTDLMELIVADVGKGDVIGFFSAPLNQIAMHITDDSPQYDLINSLMWMDLSLSEAMNASQADRRGKKSGGKLRCAVILSPKSNIDETNEYFVGGIKSRFIQISPNMEGPWTTVRLNYAAPAACWRLGNHVVASQVNVKDGKRNVNIRSLVSVHNNTDFVLDLNLVSYASSEIMERPADKNTPEGIQVDGNRIQTDEFFETETYDPSVGWIGYKAQLNQINHKLEAPSRQPLELSYLQVGSG
ncbi:Pleckstrin (PH) domain-containing protein isoform 2 [Hibiscus syriacus]|uniref:Pleckstrin (PH) domain-containing protein isoform 2 n=1 Tax=Hibiscus syriacus TaxID=106335 RepID=A0A6A3CRD6_HIBSY|nr:Pleckstrin (PH) domain-containing protein isoform 2 [Hibiscus syriacus]